MENKAKIHLSNGYRLQYEKVQNAFVLLFPEGMIQLNEPSAEILKLCQGEYSQDEVITKLQQAFPDDDVKQDILDFLEVALTKGWIYEK